jgi:serine phosphatase RsbU (regulator of sigma subunit)
MPAETNVLQDLDTLNQIVTTLNRAVDVQQVLDKALAQLVDLMGLESGWIFLRDPAATEAWWGSSYVLAAHHNLPPALALDSADAWNRGCDCQGLCDARQLDEAYNEVACSRLLKAGGDRKGLQVHASVPLRSGDRYLGILNMAGPDWDAFSPRALALLSNVGSQMGIALERARLYDLLQAQRVNEQVVLLDVSNQLLSRLDRDDLLAYLVEEARRVLQADACALMLTDEEDGALSVRAASGWRVDPVAAGRQLPAGGEGGSARVMREQQPLLIEDLQAGEASAGMPEWVRAEGFRGHAIVPLIANGRSVGVLVLDTRHPRQGTAHELRFLRLFANQAALAIEQARLRQEEVRRRQFEREMELGREIQLSLLPRACPRIPGWECAAVYLPARQVGGDLYDFFGLRGEPSGPDDGAGRRLGMVVGDVAGKGVPAALFMALSRTMIRTSALAGRNPAAALIRANDLIRNDSHSDLFVTAVYGVLEPEAGRLVYANAGHQRPLWFQAASGQVKELAAAGIALGVLSHVDIEEREVVLAPGDLLLYYTDGITEAMDAGGRQFGLRRLEEVFRTSAAAGAQGVLDRIVEAVADFRENEPQSDDLTLVVLQRKPAGA